MQVTARDAVILLVVAVCAFVLGRLAVRGVGNVLMGGTLFGGDVL